MPGAIVIDPLTIDEIRIPIKDDSLWYALRQDDKYKEYHSRRWKLTDPAIAPEEMYSNPFIELSDPQIRQVRKGIMQQVVDRDFRLIDQSKRVVAYRPYYPEEGDEKFGMPPMLSTQGVTREIQFAADLERAVWAFHPKCDWRAEQEDDLFGQRMWNGCQQFPSRTDMRTLANDDFSGFADLLAEIDKLLIRL